MLYDVGDSVRSTVTFSTTAVPPVNTDPTVVTVTVDPPGTGLATHAYGVDINVVRTAVGVYHFDIPLTVAGRWNVRWNGSGAIVASDTVNFLVA